MSLLTQAYILERYGLRLNTEQLAEVLGITKPALYNQISAGACPVKTYLDAGKRWADYRDVAAHFDAVRLQEASVIATIKLPLGSRHHSLGPRIVSTPTPAAPAPEASTEATPAPRR